MASEYVETKTDHSGNELPEGVFGVVRQDGSFVGYKVRWREEDDDGVRRNPAKRFSARKLGTLDRALIEACDYRKSVVEISKRGEAVLRPDRAARMTVADLFNEWLTDHAAVKLTDDYAASAIYWWDREIATRTIVRVRLGRLDDDPSIITRFQDDLVRAGLTAHSRIQVLKVLRSVLRWGRRRYPRSLTLELAGLFELPSQVRQRLPYATDAVAVERLIEAAASRRARNPLLPIRDAALIAAMGFTIASRPSEWLRSAEWGGLYEQTVEFQRPIGRGHELALDADLDGETGLKTGARAALLFRNAHDRLMAYRDALETRYGPQPDHGLVFQAVGPDGPIWSDDGKPMPWTNDAYNRWAARVWRPARERAAGAPGVPRGVGTMRFYDLRHTAISLALHSTLVMSEHGMNLHNLAAWAGHDVQTLQRTYAHIIARHRGRKPIDLKREFARARASATRKPYVPTMPLPGPQRAAQRRRRARAGDAVPAQP
jgi:hypothetical protein